MKILAISGSLRPQSSNTAILQLVSHRSPNLDKNNSHESNYPKFISVE
jgi:NAD(P)H-dependent FMN reductase